MEIIEVKKDNFEEEVLNSNKKVLVDFNANWCGPCKMIRPILEEIASNNDKVKIVSINVDDEEELTKEYGVMSIPCLVLFNQGKETERKIGLMSKEDLETFIGE